MILYLRHERTDDHIALAQLDEDFIAEHPDVCAYRDEDCTQFAGRWPWYYSSLPKLNTTSVMLNCARYQVKWVQQEMSLAAMPG